MTTVLIVEDDVAIADILGEVLTDAGYAVCGTAGTVAEAVEMGNAHHPDLAVMDLRLTGGEMSTAVVPLLTECGRVGILYATGNDTLALTRADGDVAISKPYKATELLRALQMVQQIVAGKSAVVPAHSSMRVLA